MGIITLESLKKEGGAANTSDSVMSWFSSKTGMVASKVQSSLIHVP